MALSGTIAAGSEKKAAVYEPDRGVSHLSRHPEGCMGSRAGVSGGVPGYSQGSGTESWLLRSQEGHWGMSSPAWHLPQG